MRRILVWLLMLAAIAVLAYEISIPHSQRPCLELHTGDCHQLTTGETHM